MDFMSVVRERRSIRRYKDQRVEPEKVEALVEAALRADEVSLRLRARPLVSFPAPPLQSAQYGTLWF